MKEGVVSLHAFPIRQPLLASALALDVAILTLWDRYPCDENNKSGEPPLSTHVRFSSHSVYHRRPCVASQKRWRVPAVGSLAVARKWFLRSGLLLRHIASW